MTHSTDGPPEGRISTQMAQRRLLETIADLRETPAEDWGDSGDPFLSFAAGMDIAIQVAIHADQPALARIYASLGGLALTVRDDLTKENTNG